MTTVAALSALVFSILLMFAFAFSAKKRSDVLWVLLALILMFLLRTTSDYFVLHVPLLFVLRGWSWEIWIAYGGLIGLSAGYLAKLLVSSRKAKSAQRLPPSV
jgi:hypothetical protein